MDTPNAVPNQVIEPSKKEKKNSWLIYFLMFIIVLLVAAVSAAVTYIVIKDSEDNASEETQENNPTEENTDEETNDSTSEDTEEVSDERALRVYFQKFPEATHDYSFVDAVFRTTTRTDETIFVLEEFLKGPTVVEEAAGFKGIDPVTLSGSSNCSGKDFKLNISGTTATFQFCKAASGLSDNTSQVSVPISENIKYYNSEVDKVIILDKDGNCFNDLSGMNACLN